MSSYRPKILLILQLLSSISSLVRGQIFSETEDGTELSLGVPKTLSKACQATFNETVQCNAGLGSMAFKGAFPASDRLASICTEDCYKSLNAFRSRQNEACSKETFKLDGRNTPATYNVDQLLFTYDYVCLRDGRTKDFCASLIHMWSDKNGGPTPKQSCSECMLRTFQVELNSPFGYDEEFAEYYSSLTSSCQVTDYPFTSPNVYFVEETATATQTQETTNAAESTETHSEYRGDVDGCFMSFPVPASCYATSVKTVPGTWTFPSRASRPTQQTEWRELPLAPGTPSDCAAYAPYIDLPPKRGRKSVVNRCLVVANIFDENVTDFVSLNPSLSWNADDFTECELQKGYRYCIRKVRRMHTSTGSNGLPTPLPIQNDIVSDCTKFYYVKGGDHCDNIASEHKVYLSDFYKWNPAVKDDCSKLYSGFYVCVGVGHNGTSAKPSTETQPSEL
ncbi:uncharacterized protein B0J16DRAFT_387001 [Fusarium flagelliforme]|uniref:uncharacterized protein n=1 Tax=Fusarium flagelliforme TaxID=2675880 RepID=UPI001E8DE09D|nr:uncharacterized protein B0J16DRAFT_387001 [Fusarium flagelliforme]KAH7179170.1 hypothetical protein B0J16DRAFT_387001 [Fusarium flagelliforme]